MDSATVTAMMYALLGRGDFYNDYALKASYLKQK